MNRTTIFARSSNQRRMHEQLQRCLETAFCKGLLLEGAAIVVDDCGRGTDTVDKRPAYAHLLEQVRTGRCDLVVVEELIVLTADMFEFAELLTLVRARALRIVTVDGLDIGWFPGQ